MDCALAVSTAIEASSASLHLLEAAWHQHRLEPPSSIDRDYGMIVQSLNWGIVTGAIGRVMRVVARAERERTSASVSKADASNLPLAA